VAGYFLVRQARGPTWDASRGRRDQSGWNEHVAFIERLSQDGKVQLGGPIGDVNGQPAVLVVLAGSEDDARAMFADDPWIDRILIIESVEPWTLWIGAENLGDHGGRPAAPSDFGSVVLSGRTWM
jgi:uncharacterized protein YciI